MEAPEKVYIDDFGSGFSHGWHTEHSYEKDIEYIRKDVFIEKACEFLSKSSNYNEGFIYPSHSGVIDAFVNNFKNYIKGE